MTPLETMKLTPIPSQTGAPTWRARIDPSWKPLLTQITTLKDALDHATRWHGAGGNEVWINEVLGHHGMKLEHFAEAFHAEGAHQPHKFVEKLLGAEFRIKYMAEGERMMVIPPWAVVGWVREHDYQDTPNKSMTTKKSVARAMAVDEKAKTAVWKDFPLFLAEEGKNRTQLHRLAGVHRQSPVFEMPFPVIHGFVASPVPFFPWAVAIRSSTHPVQILPFRRITEELVKKLGMRWSNDACWTAFFKLLRMSVNDEAKNWRERHPRWGIGLYLRLKLIAAR